MKYKVIHKLIPERYLTFTITPVTSETLLAEGWLYEVEIQYSHDIRPASWAKGQTYKARTDTYFEVTTDQQNKLIWRQRQLRVWSVENGELNTPRKLFGSRRELEYAIENLVRDWILYHNQIAAAMLQQAIEFPNI